MESHLISLEAAQYFLMHLLGAQHAGGVLFLVRRRREFGLLPFFPSQGMLRPEEDLRSAAEVVNTLLAFVAQGWEITGRLQLEFSATRSPGSFWGETLAQLAELDAAWPDARAVAAAAQDGVAAQPDPAA
jgi:hypothetical protein